MPPKAHRALLGRVSGYADEAAAFLRRRRLTRRPFARVHTPGGRIEAVAPDTAAGRELFLAAARVTDAARPPARAGRGGPRTDARSDE